MTATRATKWVSLHNLVHSGNLGRRAVLQLVVKRADIVIAVHMSISFVSRTSQMPHRASLTP